MFIPRDYSVGCGVQFQTKLPPELEGKIDRDKFEFTVTSLNNLYTEAESANCSTYTEGGQQGRLKELGTLNLSSSGCMACLTAYVIFFCSETHYEKCLRKVSRFIHEQNESVWTKRGLLLTDPVERGLRVIEITLLTEPLQPEVQVPMLCNMANVMDVFYEYFTFRTFLEWPNFRMKL